MARVRNPTKNAAAKTSTASTKASPKIDKLAEAGRLAILNYKHAQTTRTAYTSARKCAILWLEQVCLISLDQETLKEHPDFILAFEGAPKASSAKALAMYITFKCFHQGLSKSTGITAHAAMKKYWGEL